MISNRFRRKKMSAATTPAATATHPSIASHGIHTGSFGRISELIKPTPSPSATMTKIDRSTTRATVGMGKRLSGAETFVTRKTRLSAGPLKFQAERANDAHNSILADADSST